MGTRFSARPDRPWGPPSLLYNGYRVFPGIKFGRGVLLTPHPLLVPWSRKGRAIPLLPQWAVRSVQSHSACTRVHCTFTYLTVKAIPLLPLWAVQPVQSHNACTKVHFIFTLCGYKSTTFSDCVLYQIYHHLQKRSSELHGKFQEFRYVNLLLRYPMLPNCLFVQYPWKPNGVSFGRHFQ